MKTIIKAHWTSSALHVVSSDIFHGTCISSRHNKWTQSWKHNWTSPTLHAVSSDIVFHCAYSQEQALWQLFWNRIITQIYRALPGEAWSLAVAKPSAQVLGFAVGVKSHKSDWGGWHWRKQRSWYHGSGKEIWGGKPECLVIGDEYLDTKILVATS